MTTEPCADKAGEPLGLAAERPVRPGADARKRCTCDGAGRGPGRQCVVKAGGSLGELWRCADGHEFAGAYGLEVDAGRVGAGSTLYEVTHTHGHKTLNAGDLVRMVEDPHYNNLLLRTDWTLHLLADEHGQYVHIRRVPMEARA